MLNKPYFVTGIGTGVGKTVISTILASALDADYWKPVQAGDLNQSDSMTVNSLACRNHGSNWPETFALKYAIAPQKAAEIEG
ncbi:MAG: ATP-dependent dethiobiotin synthetase BioD, partial [Luteibaculum sp.]